MKLIPKIRRETVNVYYLFNCPTLPRFGTVDLPVRSDNWRYRGHGEALVFRWLSIVKIIGEVDKYTPGVRRG
ncbi:MAG: hypothetical protein [Edwardsiella phage MSW-3]|nr:MAG: hypothetical protein [Edwardsiella phage MSW-3]